MRSDKEVRVPEFLTRNKPTDLNNLSGDTILPRWRELLPATLSNNSLKRGKGKFSDTRSQDTCTTTVGSSPCSTRAFSTQAPKARSTRESSPPSACEQCFGGFLGTASRGSHACVQRYRQATDPRGRCPQAVARLQESEDLRGGDFDQAAHHRENGSPELHQRSVRCGAKAASLKTVAASIG